MMNVSELLDLVADDASADSLPDPAAIRRLADRRSRRSRLVALVASAAAALLVVGGLTVALSRHDDEPRPIKRISPDPGTPTARRLAYSTGRTIHWGDRMIDAGQEPVSLHVTDDGLAFTTRAGEIWFTDGKTVSRIGTARDSRLANLRNYDPGARMSSGNAGSRLVWLEDGDGEPAIVVYDTHARDEVLRAPAPVPASWEWEALTSVVGDVAYGRCASRFPEPCGADTRWVRHDLSSGKSVLVSEAAYQADLHARSRVLIFGSSAERGQAGPGPGADFRADGSRLVGLKDRDGSPGHRTAVFTAGTGRPVTLHPPEGFGPAAQLHVFEWLDDDTVALWTGATFRRPDLVTCSLGTGVCEVVVKDSSADLLPGLPGKNY